MARGDDVKPPVTARRVAAGLLLAIGIVVPLLVMTYARDEPRLGGWPFFYWYQMLLVFLTAGLTAGAYLLMRRDDKQRRARQRDGEGEGEQGSERNDGDDGAAQ